MFEVGFTEIVLIFGIALLVLGPAKLPKLAADLGRWAGRARAMARTLRTQLEQEVQQIDPLAPSTTRPTGSGYTPPPAAATPPAPAATAPAEPAPAGTDVIAGETAAGAAPVVVAGGTPAGTAPAVVAPAPDTENHTPRQDAP